MVLQAEHLYYNGFTKKIQWLQKEFNLLFYIKYYSCISAFFLFISSEDCMIQILKNIFKGNQRILFTLSHKLKLKGNVFKER